MTEGGHGRGEGVVEGGCGRGESVTEGRGGRDGVEGERRMYIKLHPLQSRWQRRS